MGRATRVCGTVVALKQTERCPMRKNDLSRSLVAFDQDSTLVAVIRADEVID